MAVNARENLLQGVRAFVKAATSLVDGKVILEGTQGPRPAMPYVSVLGITQGIAVGTDERVYDLGGAGGAQRERIRGDRRATVQIMAFGTEASDYIEAIRMATENPTHRAVCNPYGISIARVLTPVGRLAVLGTTFQERVSVDLEVAYTLDTQPATVVTAIETTSAVVLDRPNPPADLTVVATTSL